MGWWSAYVREHRWRFNVDDEVLATLREQCDISCESKVANVYHRHSSALMPAQAIRAAICSGDVACETTFVKSVFVAWRPKAQTFWPKVPHPRDSAFRQRLPSFLFLLLLFSSHMPYQCLLCHLSQCREVGSFNHWYSHVLARKLTGRYASARSIGSSV